MEPVIELKIKARSRYETIKEPVVKDDDHKKQLQKEVSMIGKDIDVLSKMPENQDREKALLFNRSVKGFLLKAIFAYDENNRVKSEAKKDYETVKAREKELLRAKINRKIEDKKEK